MKWKIGIITIQYEFEEDSQVQTFMEWLAKEFEPITIINIKQVEAMEVIPVNLNNMGSPN